MQIKKPTPKPPMITLVSTAGCGKSSLAGLFPNSIFIQAEDAGAVFETWADDVQPDLAPRLPRARRKDKNEQVFGMNKADLAVSTRVSLLEQLRWLITENHDYGTLVIDTITTLNRMFEHEVAEEYCVDNVAEAAGGFHRGYTVVQEMHSEIVNACEKLKEKKNMAIIFLAHTGMQKIKNRPDTDEYIVYSLDMHERSVPVYVSLSDAVIYLKKEEYIQDTKKDRKGIVTKYGKMVQTGERLMVTSGDGMVGFVNAKNRYKMDAEIPLPEGTNPLLELIPYFNQGE